MSLRQQNCRKPLPQSIVDEGKKEFYISTEKRTDVPVSLLLRLRSQGAEVPYNVLMPGLLNILSPE
jgi:hypothetical protein